MKVFIEAVGLAAPGLPNWHNSVTVLRGETDYQPTELERYKPEHLPANERRRATDLVRMAFRVCEDMLNQRHINLQECAAVFASSGGDYPIIDQICKALCEPERLVSPTQFHNSVHNSAAGYWSIATGSRAPSTSISAYDDSFCAGLFEATSLCVSEQLPTILAVYDIKPPEPLQSKRPISQDFGVAILLTPIRSAESLVELELVVVDQLTASKARQPALEDMRLSNPAARSLPLLELIALQQSGSVVLTGNNNPTVKLEVKPCR